MSAVQVPKPVAPQAVAPRTPDFPPNAVLSNLPPRAQPPPLSRAGSFVLRPVPPAFPPPEDADHVMDRALEDQEQEIADELVGAVLEMHGGQNVISYQVMETPTFIGLETKSEDDDHSSFVRRPMLLYLSFGTPSTGPHKHGPILRWYYTDKDLLVESPSDFMILSHITEIYAGKLTALLQNTAADSSDDQHCLTLITPDRVLNIDMGGEESIDTWLVGLQGLLYGKELMLELISNQVPDVIPRGGPVVEPMEGSNGRMFRVSKAKKNVQHSHYIAPTALALLSQGHGFTAYGYLDGVTPSDVGSLPVPSPAYCFYSARGASGQLDLSTADSREPAVSTSTGAQSPTRGEQKNTESNRPGGYLFWNTIPHLSDRSPSRRTMDPQRTMAVADIVSVFVGCRTSGFFQFKKPTTQPTHCLSVIGRHESGEMVYLDLEAQSVTARNAWVNGLYALLSEIGKQIRVEIPQRRHVSLNRQDSRVSLTHRSSFSSLDNLTPGWPQNQGGEVSLLEPSGLISSLQPGTPVAGVTNHGLRHTGNTLKYQPGTTHQFFHSARWSSIDSDNDGFASFHARLQPDSLSGNLYGGSPSFAAPTSLVSSVANRGRSNVSPPPPPNMTAFHVTSPDPPLQNGGPDDSLNEESSSLRPAQPHLHHRGQTVGVSGHPEVQSHAADAATTSARARLRFLSDSTHVRNAIPNRLSIPSKVSAEKKNGKQTLSSQRSSPNCP